jgi:hypothetical protein
MGNWYRVTKRIRGRRYDYWQRTERHGTQIKTFNKYIGPAGGAITSAPGTTAASRQIRTPPSLSPALSPPTVSNTAPPTPEEAISQLKPPLHPDAANLRESDKLRQREISDWESVKYGSVKQRSKRQEIKQRAATHNARATGAINPFLGQAINRLKEEQASHASKAPTSHVSPPTASQHPVQKHVARPKKQLPPFPKDHNFSDPFWQTASTSKQLRDQAQVVYTEYRRLCVEFNNKRVAEQLSALIPFSSSEAAALRTEIQSIKSQLDWYQGKAQSHFDYAMQFTQSGKVRLSRSRC